MQGVGGWVRKPGFCAEATALVFINIIVTDEDNVFHTNRLFNFHQFIAAQQESCPSVLRAETYSQEKLGSN